LSHRTSHIAWRARNIPHIRDPADDCIIQVRLTVTLPPGTAL
jgi:hypothetical protein